MEGMCERGEDYTCRLFHRGCRCVCVVGGEGLVRGGTWSLYGTRQSPFFPLRIVWCGVYICMYTSLMLGVMWESCRMRMLICDGLFVEWEGGDDSGLLLLRGFLICLYVHTYAHDYHERFDINRS